jgi:Tol biopolymer transport system component
LRGGRDEGPTWSPDGRYLAYDRHTNCDGSREASRDVVISDPEGNVVAEFPADGWQISWSPDATRVAVWVRFGKTIGVYGADGERRALLAMPRGFGLSGDYDPMWLPDGKSLRLQSVVIPTDGSTPYKLPSAPTGIVPPPGWRATRSPDGSRVAYTPRHHSLVVAKGDRSNRQAVFDGWAWDPVWSPTGDRIAFASARTRSRGLFFKFNQIRVVDLATGTVTLLAEAGGSDTLEVIDFSPTGDRIFFSRDYRIRVSSLWSVNADRSHLRRLVPGTGDGDWLSPGPTPESSPPSPVR